MKERKAGHQNTGREICPLCGKEFGSRAEHEEHKEFVHTTMNKKTTLAPDRGAGHEARDIEPADNKPTTELPPGDESAPGQSRPRNGGSAPAKSRGAAN